MYTYIYIYLNPQISGNWTYKEFNFEFQPIYVGMGVDRRWKDHLRMTKSKEEHEPNKNKFKMIQSLIESNSPPIVLKLYENLSRGEAKIIEVDIIKHFGKSIDHTGILTNITDGGVEMVCCRLGKANPQSKKVYQYSLNGDFIKEWDSLREIGRILNKCYNTIGGACRGTTKTAFGYQWSYIYLDKLNTIKPHNQIAKYKKVFKFDSEGNLIEIYDSLSDAAKQNNTFETYLSNKIINKGIFKDYFYSYENTFNPKICSKHKIKFNDEIYYLTNKEIQKKFNVCRSYLYSIIYKRKKNSIFSVED